MSYRAKDITRIENESVLFMNLTYEENDYKFNNLRNEELIIEIALRIGRYGKSEINAQSRN
jgi:hypothetical protein